MKRLDLPMTTYASPDRTIWFLRFACLRQFVAFGVVTAFEGVWLQTRGLSESQIGNMAFVYMLLILLGGILWGRLAERNGGAQYWASSGCILFCAAIWILTESETLFGFWSYALIRGLGYGMIMIPMPMLVMSILQKGAEGKGFSRYWIFGSMGYIIGTLLLAFLIASLQLRLWLSAILVFMAVLPLLHVRDNPPRKTVSKRYSPVLSRPVFLLFLICMFLYSCTMPAAYLFLSTFAHSQGAGDGLIGLLFGLCGILALPALPLFGWLADRFGAHNLLGLAFLFHPLRLISVTWMPDVEWLLLPQVIHVISWGIPESLAIPFAMRLAGRESRLRGTVVGLYFGICVVGIMAGMPLAGVCAEHFGYATMFTIMACVAGVVVLVYARTWWRLLEQRPCPESSA